MLNFNPNKPINHINQIASSATKPDSKKTAIAILSGIINAIPPNNSAFLPPNITSMPDKIKSLLEIIS